MLNLVGCDLLLSLVNPLDSSFSSSSDFSNLVSNTNSYVNDYVTVTFDSNNGEELKNIEVEKGNSVNKPNAPIYENYNFVGWFNGKDEFDFSTKIYENLT